MNQIKKLFVLLIVSALVACSQTPNGNDAPPLFIMEQPTSGDHSFINFSVDEIKILGGTGDPIGMESFVYSSLGPIQTADPVAPIARGMNLSSFELAMSSHLLAFLLSGLTRTKSVTVSF